MGRQRVQGDCQSESAKATGLPVWVAFTASMAPDGETVRLDVGDDRGYVGGRKIPMWASNWRTINYDMTLAEGIAEIAPLKPDVIGVFHATPAETTPALQVVLDEWSGPVIAYPDAGRDDYLETWQDSGVANRDTAEEFKQDAAKWVDMGAQVVGTCCGFGVDYIKGLQGALPDRISSPRKVA